MVCDNGTGVSVGQVFASSCTPQLLNASWCLQFVKCGFAGANFPTAIFPCVVGRPLPANAGLPNAASPSGSQVPNTSQHHVVRPTSESLSYECTYLPLQVPRHGTEATSVSCREFLWASNAQKLRFFVQGVLVGEQCSGQAQRLDLSYPISHGVVQSWEDMHHVWDHTWRVLGLDAAARSRSRILLTEPPLNPLASRRRLLDTMLVHYGFAGVQLQVQAVLTLYAQGARISNLKVTYWAHMPCAGAAVLHVQLCCHTIISCRAHAPARDVARQASALAMVP